MEKNKMGYVPIPKLITTMALPVIFSMLIQSFYNVVDSIFVSRVSEQALTAVSLAFPMQLIVIAVFVGLATGISSVISRKLGANDHDAAVQVAEHGVLIALILYALVAVFGIFVVHFLYEGFSIGSFKFAGFTDDQTIIDYSIEYIRIIMICSFGSIFANAGLSIFRGTGNMIQPMIAQLIGTILNIILDPILIFGYLGFPAMGVKGAAIATVTARAVVMIYIWIQLLAGKSIIKMKIKALKLNLKIVKQIIAVGIPSAIMQALGSVMLFSMNFILSRFGDSAIAVMGVYFRTQSMVYMPIFGLSMGTMPVVGFNFGAKNKERLIKAVKFSTTTAFIFMTVCLVLFQVFPKQLLGLFKASEHMLKIGVPTFRIISFIFPFSGITIILSSAFQGLGKAYYSLVISLIRQLVVLIPFAFFFATFNNVDIVWYAFIIAELVGVTLTVIMFARTYKRSTKGWKAYS